MKQAFLVSCLVISMYLLRTLLSTTKEEERAASLAALHDSEDPALSLYVALEQANLEAKK